ncbi:MAG: hypothetical protein J6X28_02390 [Bacilli bacterium]|nr:hypothetical protein [Bacilli bacterium]
MEKEKSTATLKVKYIHPINPESLPFEDFISSHDTSIKIDFPDGRSLMEHEFRKLNVPMEKFYLEFFDSYSMSEMMEYLTRESSDFRATSMDGSVVRLSHQDMESIPKEITEDVSDQPLKEYVFVKEKESLFQRLKNIVHKKEH